MQRLTVLLWASAVFVVYAQSDCVAAGYPSNAVSVSSASGFPLLGADFQDADLEDAIDAVSNQAEVRTRTWLPDLACVLSAG